MGGSCVLVADRVLARQRGFGAQGAFVSWLTVRTFLKCNLPEDWLHSDSVMRVGGAEVQLGGSCVARPTTTGANMQSLNEVTQVHFASLGTTGLIEEKKKKKKKKSGK